ncbi:hypothetical protein Tco_0379596 [Tanacetum coccineum]
MNRLLLHFSAWLPMIIMRNFVLDLYKKQKSPIFQISVDILQNTNFFRAFTASASVPAIYIQQFWNTPAYEAKTEITPIDQAYQFVSPPSGDAIVDFVNELGYTEAIHFVSRMAVNNLYQPWRAILSMINQCLTDKTSGYDRPRYPVLQMLWGIITSTNVDFAELMWEEFVQAIQTFLTDKANLGSSTKKGRKDKPHAIPYCQFTKLIICHLGRIYNIHQRSTSSFHLAKDDFRLRNLKFVPKGEVDEVFGMPIPNELISNNIRNAPYYNAYLEMVAKHDQKVAAEKEGKKKTLSTKQPKSKSAIEKSSKPAHAAKPKPAKEKPSKPSNAKPPQPKPSKPTPLQKTGKGKVIKVLNMKSSFRLVDKPDEEPAQPEPEPEPEQEGKEYDMERAIQMSLESFQSQGHAHVGGNGKAIVTEEQAAQSLLALHTPKRRSTTDQFIFQRKTIATEEALTGPSAQLQDDTSANIICDSPSSADAKTGAGLDKTNSGCDIEVLQITDELGEDVDEQVNLEEKTVKLDQDQAGSDPGETHESRPPPEQVLKDEDQARPDPGISRMALAGPDPEPMHDEFMANLYLKFQESLKFSADEHVILEDPLSSTGTLSSMKNLEGAYAIGDHFINDKSTDDELGKLNVEAEVVSMVTVPIYQASSSVPPLLTPKFTAFEQKSKNLDNTTQNLGSRVFTLELRDLPHKINEVVRENVKEANISYSMKLLRHLGNDSDPSKKRRHDSGASGSSQPPATQSSAWKSTDTRDAPSSSSKQQSGPYSKQPVEDIPMPDTISISDSEDTGSAHLPHIKPRPEWLKPIPEDDRPPTPKPAWVIPTSHIPDVVNNWANALATTYQALVENSLLDKIGDMQTFLNWYCQKIGKTELTQANLEGQAYEVVEAFYPDVVQLQFQMEECTKCLQIRLTRLIQKVIKSGLILADLCLLVVHLQALLISKMKAARYHDFGLELLVPEHIWINDVCTYDIKKDFKNLYPNDFEDLNLLHLQGHINHLPGSNKRMFSTAINMWTRNLVIRQRVEDFQLGIESYHKQLNLTKPGWDAKGYEYKHDYTIIELPRTVVFPFSNNERKIMRFNEIYKFSDGTLINILEALDYRVKEYKVNRLNPSMNTWFWTDKDVTIKHPSDTYVFTMKMEILLEPTSNKLMVGDSDVYTLEDPTLILEIMSRRFFLRLNLPDHRSVLTGSGGSSKDGDGDTSF